ncbi:hypothetical protein EI427_21170 [Flammeovirga pectinis]|uniref:Uncharacterized protein n=1 Tax=Flammeovirga pectinis TaxID=2494373 RepID=A0A3S9P946_9BACT|nr:hypothetical protein [Flammeovirga pectinis]AZQ64738.1 hypothetical protein EI427_21170 [Flammeovirga pectinis]
MKYLKLIVLLYLLIGCKSKNKEVVVLNSEEINNIINNEWIYDPSGENDLSKFKLYLDGAILKFDKNGLGHFIHYNSNQVIIEGITKENIEDSQKLDYKIDTRINYFNEDTLIVTLNKSSSIYVLNWLEINQPINTNLYFYKNKIGNEYIPSEYLRKKISLSHRYYKNNLRGDIHLEIRENKLMYYSYRENSKKEFKTYKKHLTQLEQDTLNWKIWNANILRERTFYQNNFYRENCWPRIYSHYISLYDRGYRYNEKIFWEGFEEHSFNSLIDYLIRLPFKGDFTEVDTTINYKTKLLYQAHWLKEKNILN